MKNICLAPGCGKNCHGLGYCGDHYRRLRRYGDPKGVPAPFIDPGCKIPGCGKAHLSLGLCSSHYEKARKYGDPEHKQPVLKCSMPGCEKKHYGLNLCGPHYQKFRNCGDPAGRPRVKLGPRECSTCGVVKIPEEFYTRSQCKICYRKHQHQIHKKDPNWKQYIKDGHILRRYGLTPEAYRALLESQGGVCAICKQPETAKNRSLSIDHDHVSGKVRGVLCTACNAAIGLLRESIPNLSAAIDYLKRSDSGTK